LGWKNEFGLGEPQDQGPFCEAGLYPNYLISSKQKTWYYKLLLNAEFSYCGIQDGSVVFQGLGDSDIPQLWDCLGLPDGWSIVQ